MGLAGLFFERMELFLSVVGENPSTVRELELEALIPR